VLPAQAVKKRNIQELLRSTIAFLWFLGFLGFVESKIGEKFKAQGSKWDE
jgi:hypothetical protein